MHLKILLTPWGNTSWGSIDLLGARYHTVLPDLDGVPFHGGQDNDRNCTQSYLLKWMSVAHNMKVSEDCQNSSSGARLWFG